MTDKPRLLNDWKKENDLTNSDIAELLGCSLSHVSYVLSGKRGLSARRLVKLSKFSGIPIGDLIGKRKSN